MNTIIYTRPTAKVIEMIPERIICGSELNSNYENHFDVDEIGGADD